MFLTLSITTHQYHQRWTSLKNNIVQHVAMNFENAQPGQPPFDLTGNFVNLPRTPTSLTKERGRAFWNSSSIARGVVKRTEPSGVMAGSHLRKERWNGKIDYRGPP